MISPEYLGAFQANFFDRKSDGKNLVGILFPKFAVDNVARGRLWSVYDLGRFQTLRRCRGSGNNPIHGYFMRLWKDRPQRRIRIAGADSHGFLAHASKGAIEEPASVSESIAFEVKAD